VGVFRRALRVVAAFLPFVAAYLRDRRRFLLFGRPREVTERVRRERAERLRGTLVELGPAFVKLGQVLSTRPDALPPAYVEALAELQDRVPPAEWESAREVIEDELGPLDTVFESFDTNALSGASLGQVYEGRAGGQRVAVKVRRPGVKARVERDLAVVDALLPVVLWALPESQAYTLETLSGEFETTVRQEMDYEREARMLTEIGDNLAARGKIRVPVVDESRSTERVLTMEYVEGVKIDNTERLDELEVDRSELVRRVEEAYIGMIAEDGLFHADPHPGNLAVQPDGTLVFYDFGMTGELDERTRERLFEFYGAVAAEDTDALIDAFVEMGALPPDADRELFGRAFELALEGFRGGDVREREVRELIADFEEQLYEFPLRLPRELALVVRVTTVLEGVCRTLDPDFDFLAVVSEYVAENVTESPGERIAADVRAEARDGAQAVPRIAPKFERALDRADRDGAYVRAGIGLDGADAERFGQRAVLGLVGASLSATAAILYTAGELALAGAGVFGVLLVAGLLLRSVSARERAGEAAAGAAGRQLGRRRG
jgi:predicted unusual protein kinase regulating ubiquinone biosynthesis (AarF/ABC1/UbiB family)